MESWNVKRASFGSDDMPLLSNFKRVSQVSLRQSMTARRSSMRSATFDLFPLPDKRSLSGVTLKETKPRASPFSEEVKRRSSSVKEAHELASANAKRMTGYPFYQPLELITEFSSKSKRRSPVFIPHKGNMAARSIGQERYPVNLHTVTVPKKGLIKLTGLPYEFDNPQYYDDRKERPRPRKYWDHVKFRYLL